MTDSLAPLLDSDDLSEFVRQVVDELVGIGDLVECIEESTGVRRTVVYLGHPRFVRRANGDALLLGVRPDALPLVSEDLGEAVEGHRFLRRLPNRPDMHDVLAAEGLHEVKSNRWLRSPDVVSAEELIAGYDDRLQTQGHSGEIEGLRILDTGASPTFYRGRWCSPLDHSGHFVARRGQRYGSDLWSYVELDHGQPVRLLDLPVLTHERGCDEAWRLQAGLDCRNGSPQQIVVERTGHGRVALGLFAPPPRWLQRRWELVGQVGRVPGCLVAYEFTPGDLVEELRFASERLWLTRRIALGEDGNDN